MTKKNVTTLCVVALCLSAALPQAASRADMTYGFTRISSNGIQNIEDQLTVTVSSYSAGQVLFTFKNESGGIPSRITSVYFDDGALLSLADLIDADQNGGDLGVDFTQFIAGNPGHGGDPVTPGELPEGNALDPDFETTVGFAADIDNPVEWGVDPGETLGVIFTLKSHGDGTPMDIDDVASFLADGGLRIGLHVQSIGTDGASDAFVNTVPHLPVPGAVLLGVLGLGTTGLRLRRKG